MATTAFDGIEIILDTSTADDPYMQWSVLQYNEDGIPLSTVDQGTLSGAGFEQIFVLDPGRYFFRLISPPPVFPDAPPELGASNLTRVQLYDYGTAALLFELNSQSQISNQFGAGIPFYVGADAETEASLSVTYGTEDPTIVDNPGGTLYYSCSELYITQGDASTLPDLIAPGTIIGNLENCSSIGSGDTSKTSPCAGANQSSIAQYFQIFDKDNQVLYSRVECCCPTVTEVSVDIAQFPICTCPDWSRFTSYNQTLFSSSIRLRNWIDSGAGARGDCKHIMAYKRIRNIDQPTYTDEPYDFKPPPSTPQ
jgi:hypothetical protein